VYDLQAGQAFGPSGMRIGLSAARFVYSEVRDACEVIGDDLGPGVSDVDEFDGTSLGASREVIAHRTLGGFHTFCIGRGAGRSGGTAAVEFEHAGSDDSLDVSGEGVSDDRSNCDVARISARANTAAPKGAGEGWRLEKERLGSARIV
jgi:hypothetical protein